MVQTNENEAKKLADLLINNKHCVNSPCSIVEEGLAKLNMFDHYKTYITQACTVPCNIHEMAEKHGWNTYADLLKKIITTSRSYTWQFRAVAKLIDSFPPKQIEGPQLELCKDIALLFKKTKYLINKKCCLFEVNLILCLFLNVYLSLVLTNKQKAI